MNKLKKIITVLLIMSVFFINGCASLSDDSVNESINQKSREIKVQATSTNNNSSKSQVKTSISGKLRIDYIDVGQGDSILIEQGSQSMLIDAGNNADGNLVTSYIKKLGIKKLDYVIGTHPHEDHIGGMDTVINNFSVGKIYLPQVTINTRTFEDVLTSIKNKKLKISKPVPGSSFKLGQASVTILGPLNSTESDLNTYSIVTKVVFGSNSFLFMGDAQVSNEKAMVEKGYDLKADVLKLGHHGSDTSTSEAFLNKVKPKYAVISCGKNNIYGHPHKETMYKLKNAKIKVYRTDEQGNIVAVSNGSVISFNENPGNYKFGSKEKDGAAKNTSSKEEQTNNNSSTEVNKKRTVYWTTYGKSYHYDKDCPTLKRSKSIHQGTLAECPKKDPCDICVR